VKITVIATGFGPIAPPRAARPLTSGVQTPVDMTHYAEHPRMRPDSPAAAATAAADRLAPARLSIARRSLPDLPLAAGGGRPGSTGAHAPGTAEALTGSATDGEGTNELAIEQDGDFSSTFDVPAFLRRQES
jgi:hypothetical protein